METRYKVIKVYQEKEKMFDMNPRVSLSNKKFCQLSNLFFPRMH